MALLLSYAKTGDSEEILKKIEEFKPKINERDRCLLIWLNCAISSKKNCIISIFRSAALGGQHYTGQHQEAMYCCFMHLSTISNMIDEILCRMKLSKFFWKMKQMSIWPLRTIGPQSMMQHVEDMLQFCELSWPPTQICK